MNLETCSTSPATPARIWSSYQLAIFHNIEEGRGHTVVRARAGSGKTSTIVEALRHVPAGKSCLLVAFNKSIATELGSRAPQGCEVATLHSYGLRAVQKAFGKQRVDGKKVETMARAKYGSDSESWEIRRALVKIVSLAKGTLADTVEALDSMADAFGIDLDMTERERAGFLRDCLDVLTDCKRLTGTVDFDDMIWLPVVHHLKLWQYDRVFVDETQDLNACQIELALRAVKGTGRICAVGDDRQAIYAFRGADSNALGNVVERLSAKVMPLSVTYRCARAIVAEAKTLVSDFEWAPDCAEGEVSGCEWADMVKDAGPGDFILSRTNAPLIGLCLGFLREGRRANIQGRDVGASLTAFVKKSGCLSVDAFRAHVEAWSEAECARLAKKDRDTQATEDRADCLLALSEGAQSTAEVLARIEALFSDTSEGAKIVLSTTHKAKGLERDRVFLIADTYRKRPGIEEDNLYYVAVTRARKTLRLVAGKRN